jgi:hypothetical protein
MKKLAVIAALALLATSPALARSRHAAFGQGAAPNAFNNAYAGVNDPTAAVIGSRIVGRDPDAAIRNRLWLQYQNGLYK